MSAKGSRTPRKPVARDWQWAIDDYLHNLAARGYREATRELRSDELRHMARCLGCPPDEVTAAGLMNWFGSQTHWAVETRRHYRSAARGFFTWLYEEGRAPVSIAAALPVLRQPKASPRPAPDDVWRSAMAAADPRTRLMLRLAAEAGLRRGEVAQVHTRDVFIAAGAGQIVVRGKGGKQRIVPISDDLAERLRQGAAGHTPGDIGVRVGVSRWFRRPSERGLGGQFGWSGAAEGLHHALPSPPFC